MDRRKLLLGSIMTFLMSPAVAIEPGFINDFEDGLTAGWQEGGPSPNPPVVEDGGDQGPGDKYLSNLSTGGGAGSRQKMFNRDPQWQGDYIQAGITHIQMNIANFSNQTVPIRVAFQEFKIFCWASDAIEIPPGGSWGSYEFSIAEDDMVEIFSFENYQADFSDIGEILILAAEQPGCSGDNIDVTIGYDDIEAVGETVFADSDEDSVTDNVDNCTLVSNPDQEDADGDGHGNLCDADVDQSCGPVNFADLQLLADGFFTENPILDLDSSGGPINFADLQIMAELFFQAPGPSAAGALCNSQ